MHEIIYFNTKIIVNNIFSSYKPIIKYNSNKIDPLSFDFVRNNSFNASSCYEDKECRISIDKTAIDILHFYFSQVTDEYFKKINEKFTSNQEDAYSFSFETVIFKKNGIVFCSDSKNEKQNLTEALIYFSLQFMIAHELGHIFNGHCEYKKSLSFNQNSRFQIFEPETANKKSTGLSPLDQRTLEYDADAFATTDNFRFLLQEVISNPSQLGIIYWWSFAITSLFLKIGSIQMATSSPTTDMRYLTSSMRWRTIYEIVETIIHTEDYNIKYNDEEFIKRIEKLLFFGSLDAEKYFKEINVESNLSYISDAINSKYDNNYFTEIQNNWNTLYKKLQPYAHLPLFKNKNK